MTTFLYFQNLSFISFEEDYEVPNYLWWFLSELARVMPSYYWLRSGVVNWHGTLR